jgi:hypothetical protein
LRQPSRAPRSEPNSKSAGLHLADREQFQKGFPGCRFRGATVIADDSPVEEAGFEPQVPPEDSGGFERLEAVTGALGENRSARTTAIPKDFTPTKWRRRST